MREPPHTCPAVVCNEAINCIKLSGTFTPFMILAPSAAKMKNQNKVNVSFNRINKNILPAYHFAQDMSEHEGAEVCVGPA